MKTFIRKKLSLVLVITFILSIIQFNSLTVFASTNGDFTIIAGVLTKYNGSGGSVVIPDGVTSIGSGAFQHCVNVNKITIPNTVKSIENYAFQFCNNLNTINIPSSVISIGSNAFEKCTSLTNIIIPDSVTKIDRWTFESCTGLTSITIPSSVTNIGEDIFVECTNLTSINVDSGNNKYSSEAGILFNKDKTELIKYPVGNKNRSYTIPDSVKSIGIKALESTELNSITIPSTVTSIGDYAFCSCHNLTNISLPKNLTKLGNAAFINCTNLTSMSIPEGITNIGYQEFGGCTNLNNITIPTAVTSIGNDAFADCAKLTNLTIPSTVTIIGVDAFERTPWLNNYPNDFVIVGNNILVKYKGNQDNVVIPYNVTAIAGNTFYDCTSLTNVTIPKNVKNIDGSAFWHFIRIDSMSSRVDNFDITIYGESNSYAETYAKTEKIPFKSIAVSVNNNTNNTTIKGSNIIRLGGQDRYETAVAISKSGWTQSDNVILTSGENYPDALVGSSFAYLKNAPVLITSSSKLDGNVSEEIARLKAKNVYILGSNSTISQSVDNELKQKYNVVRIGGEGLYDTAVKVGEEIRNLKQFDTVVIAPQGDFPDTLAIAPFSAINTMPILFSDKDNLRADTMAAIQKWNIKNVVIVGGTGVISNDIDNKLKSIGINVTRLAGQDRYDTALEIIKHYAPSEGYKDISIATGEAYPDALTGASLAARNNMPLVLVNKDNVKTNISEYINKNKIEKAYIFGGTGVVSNSIVSQ